MNRSRKWVLFLVANGIQPIEMSQIGFLVFVILHQRLPLETLEHLGTNAFLIELLILQSLSLFGCKTSLLLDFRFLHILTPSKIGKALGFDGVRNAKRRESSGIQA